MDAEEEDNIAYAEFVAASSSEPAGGYDDAFEYAATDDHGFTHLGMGLNDDSAFDYPQQALHVDGDERMGPQGGNAGEYEDMYLAGEARSFSSPTPSSSQRRLPSPARMASIPHGRFPTAQQYSLPSAPVQAPRRQAKPGSSFVPLRPIPRAVPVASTSSRHQNQGLPLPLNGKRNRREDYPQRQDNGAERFLPSLDGHYASQNTVDGPSRGTAPVLRPQAGSRLEQRAESEEEEYFGGVDDQAFEAALVQSTASTSGSLLPSSNQGASRAAQVQPLPRATPFTNHLRGIKLRPVSDLPDIYRRIWPFGVFNAVQSVCFETVYQSDKNLVVSAPTGAGKTVLFELAMLRMFTTSTSSDCKVVYLAPTKSLCTERANDWRKKFEQLGFGWKVIELTGDTQSGAGLWKTVKQARIIVTTPEKWDSVTRNWHDHDEILSELRLFCVDECHTVGLDVRGATLEVVVSRMRTYGTRTRFIAVSATVPNIKDIAEWLGSGPSSTGGAAVVHEFGEEFRSCPLQKIVAGYPPHSNNFSFINSLSYKVFGLIKQYASGKPVLVFCDTRNGTIQAAETVAKEYRSALDARRQDLPWRRPQRINVTFVEKKLGSLVEVGVGFHHAGMDSNDRKAIEQMFLKGELTVLCATSTLAVGVNLPARMVIVKGTSMWRNGRSETISDAEVLQMIGRAGRPDYDTSGVAVIMTESSHQAHYEELVNAKTVLESCLHQNLAEHINSEITLGTISDVQSALHWLRSTFLYVRIKKNPQHYALGTADTSPEARLEQICVEAVQNLVSHGILTNDDDVIKATAYGEMMAKFYLSQQTLVSVMALPPKANMRSLLETVSAAGEFSSFRFRQGEKALLTKVNKELRYPVTKLASSADKVMIWIQVVLEGLSTADLKTDHSNPNSEVAQIWPHATRIAKCIVDVLLERRDGAIRLAVELLRSLLSRAWDNSPCILRALEGIGEKSVKILADKGITSFEDVRKADSERLQLLLGRNAPFGRKLVNQAKSMPKFSLNLTADSEDVVDTGIRVTALVEVGLLNTKPACLVKKANINFLAIILLTTSDGEFIEFRRIRLDQLATKGPKSFSVSVVLVKPSQKIIAAVSCDMVAGSEVKAHLKPSINASEYPLPKAIASEPESESKDTSENLAVMDTGSDIDPDPSHDKKKRNSSAASRNSTKRNLAEAELDEEPPIDFPRRRDDGRYDCAHQCKDKKACLHMCCREGMKKPPARRVKSKIEAVPAPDRSALAKSKAKALSPLDSLSAAQKQKGQRIAAEPPASRLSTVALASFAGKSLAEMLQADDTGLLQDTTSDISDEDLPTLNEAISGSNVTKLKRDSAQLAHKVIKAPHKSLQEGGKTASPKRQAAHDPFAEIDELEDDSDLETPAVTAPSSRPAANSQHSSDTLVGSAHAAQGPVSRDSSSNLSLFRHVTSDAGSPVARPADSINDSHATNIDTIQEERVSPEKTATSLAADDEEDEDDDFERWLQDTVVIVP